MIVFRTDLNEFSVGISAETLSDMVFDGTIPRDARLWPNDQGNLAIIRDGIGVDGHATRWYCGFIDVATSVSYIEVDPDFMTPRRIKDHPWSDLGDRNNPFSPNHQETYKEIDGSE